MSNLSAKVFKVILDFMAIGCTIAGAIIGYAMEEEIGGAALGVIIGFTVGVIGQLYMRTVVNMAIDVSKIRAELDKYLEAKNRK